MRRNHYQKTWITELLSWTSPEQVNQTTLPRSCGTNWKPLTHLWDGKCQKGNYGSKGAYTYQTKRSSTYRLSATTMTTWQQDTSEKQGCPNSSTTASTGWAYDKWSMTMWLLV